MTDPDIQTLLDQQAIHDLVVRLTRAQDRCDRELLLSCYHPDARDEHGPFKGSPTEFADWVFPHIRRMRFIQHRVSNVLIEVRGDVAYGESYAFEEGETLDGSKVTGCGRYIDRFERRNGEWRIALRRVILEGVAPGFDASDFFPSLQSREDISYERD
ncbi:MAG: nuclear transport factor 2 family protein [Caulobacteraceae bacterium]|nr:nuclear transport factor 2 family protein [Caulobacteraceae bacterium]